MVGIMEIAPADDCSVARLSTPGQAGSAERQIWAGRQRYCFLSLMVVGLLVFIASVGYHQLSLCDGCDGACANHDQNPDEPRNEDTGSAETLAWARNRTLEAEGKFRTVGTNFWPSPSSWADAVIYQIQVDRFNNGDPTNDGLNLQEWQKQAEIAGDLSGMPSWRHGGDFQGIMDRLEYLRDLGVNTLYLTPVLHHDGRYHGYCTMDPTTTDPGFGSPETFKELVSQAHSLGINIVLDIVINHMCDTSSHYVKLEKDAQPCADALQQQYEKGNHCEDSTQAQLEFSDNFFKGFRQQKFFNRCGPCTNEQMQGEGAVTIYCDFTDGMFDYNTRDLDFQLLFTELHKYWIAFADVDGFRLDAAKHVTEDFLAYFSTHTRAFASQLGKANFLVIGEVAGSTAMQQTRLGTMMANPRDPHQHGNIPQGLVNQLVKLQDVYLQDQSFAAPGLNAIYNFQEAGICKDVLLGRRASAEMEDYFTSKDFRTVMGQLEYQCQTCEGPASLQWNLLEIHDWPRFLQDKPTSLETATAAIAWLLTSPGAPIIYYGLEQGFNGNCPAQLDAGLYNDILQAGCNGQLHDELWRQDMFMDGPWRLRSAVSEIDRLAHVGTSAANKPQFNSWQEDPMLSRTHDLYKLTKRFVALRNSCVPLRRGSIYFRWVSRQQGSQMFAFSRVFKETEILAIINAGSSTSTTFALHVDAAFVGDRFRNALSVSGTAEVRQMGNSKKLYFGEGGLQLPPGSAAVFAPEGALQPFDHVTGVALCTFAEGYVVE